MLLLSVLGCRVRVESASRAAALALEAGYGAFSIAQAAVFAPLCYRVEADGSGFVLIRDGVSQPARGIAELLYLFDKDLTFELQRLRPELYFLHAGVVARDGRALVCAAGSGGGKSTFVWALLHHGFRYLSDELAPVALASLEVQPYPHALCLKREPPEPYVLPHATLRTPERLHVPVAALPGGSLDPARIAAVLVIERRGTPGAALRRLSAAEAAARLYAVALNPLAHRHEGLEAVAAIARAIPCFTIDSTCLESACEAAAALVR